MPAEMSLFATPPQDALPPTKPAPRPSARPAPPCPSTKREPAPPPGGGPSTDDKAPSPDRPSQALEIEEGRLLLTEREAAKALSVCQRTLWQLRTDGEIPCVRIGRAVRYRPADLHAWVAASRG
jgi:excisionase family DNA binding protein